MKKVFWQDSEQAGRHTCGITRYLWHVQEQARPEAYNIAKWLRENTTMDDVLIGDSMSVPLFSLLTNRRVVGGMVDLNSMRFMANMPSMDEALKVFDDDKLKYMLFSARAMFKFPEFRNFVNAKFEVDRREGGWFIYKRRQPMLAGR